MVITEHENSPMPIYLRDKENSSRKERIAEAAAKNIRDNTTVFFDSSSTVRRMCKYIKNRRNLTVITNNLRVIKELSDSDVRVICTGGTLVSGRECFVGYIAEECLRRVKCDALFFSSQGLSENGDITDSSEEEVSLRRVAFSSAKEKYFLCDSSKKGKDYPFILCNVSDVTLAVFD